MKCQTSMKMSKGFELAGNPQRLEHSKCWKRCPVLLVIRIKIKIRRGRRSIATTLAKRKGLMTEHMLALPCAYRHTGLSGREDGYPAPAQRDNGRTHEPNKNVHGNAVVAKT